jgi:phosphatidylinositol transfer protein SFH5
MATPAKEEPFAATDAANPAAAPALTPMPAGTTAEPAPTSEPATAPDPAPAAAPTAPAPAPAPAVPETPLIKFNAALPSILEKAGHSEMWGVNLLDTSHTPTTVILQKFLRANGNDPSLAETQLANALEWRKKTMPVNLLDETTFDRVKFGDLGYVTVHKGDDGKEVVVTWNIYGSVKDNKATFGNVEE